MAPRSTATGGGAPSAVVAAVTDRSARGIASAIGRLVRDGSLAPGERLPTVRALGHQLGVSPTTVSEAWQVLAEAGAIAPRGRLGTFVVGPMGTPAPRRYRNVGQPHGHFALDLSTGTPDPDLLPDVAAVLARLGGASLTTSYLDDPVLPALGDVLRAEWPFPPEALAVVDGAMDGLDRIATTLIRIGDRVVVESPTFPPLLDLLEQLGAEVLAVEVDEKGIVPASLRTALERHPVALFTQPRAHNPLGVSAGATRVAALAKLLRGTPVTVIEDDHAGAIASAELHSVGRHLPGQTILVRSFSKSHGPDLRLAAVGGASEPIQRLVQRRMLGPGWSSRILQAVLAEMLADGSTRRTVAAAGAEYARRREALTAALTAREVGFTGRDGINLWVAVADERAAQVQLAARGIGTAPGSPFLVVPGPTQHLRLTVGLVAKGHEQLADQLHAAAGPLRSARPGSR